MKITYLFTTFPQLSERFLQREVEAMTELGVELELFSLFGGGKDFQGITVKRFTRWQWMKVPLAFFREYRRCPQAFRDLGRELRRGKPAGMINRFENLLGFAFALVWAPYFRETERHHIHAVWATAPGTAALLLQALTGARFTLGAHAYDVFRDGGDWLLEKKLRAARLIHTSTEATKNELLRRGADGKRVVMIRRGLNEFPAMNPVRAISEGDPIRLLSVGRLIEKKGFDNLIRICAALRSARIAFECRVVGGGPMRKELETLCRSMKLESCIQFLGALPYETVAECYRWADLFCFTGRIAASNDRDGLPNVMAEAMAHGIPVLSAPVSGTVEAVSDGISGYLLNPERLDEWVEAIIRLQTSEIIRSSIQRNGRAWVESNFDARENAKRLLEAFVRIE